MRTASTDLYQRIVNMFTRFAPSPQPTDPLLRVRGSVGISDDMALSRILHTVGSAEFGNRFHRLILAIEENRVVIDDDFERDLRDSLSDVETVRRDIATAMSFRPLPPMGSTQSSCFEQA